MDDENETLDMSWVVDQERILNNDCHREPIKTLRLVTIYINQYDYIDNIIKETIEVSNGSQLTQSNLLYFIVKNKRKTVFTKYAIDDILLFNVDLEPEHIQDFAKYSDDDLQIYSEKFLIKVKTYSDLNISPSMSIFHDINTIYFIYKETPIIKKNYQLISAIKPDKELPDESKKTKNIRWKNSDIITKKTKKNIKSF
jgi:hypothetical protein